jgi:hypothetical protein
VTRNGIGDQKVTRNSRPHTLESVSIAGYEQKSRKNLLKSQQIAEKKNLSLAENLAKNPANCR